MKQNKDPFERIFEILQDNTLPTNEQKERMLNHVLMENRIRHGSIWEKIENWITVYPWRFSFGVAAIQTAVCTLLFGTDYTNLLLNFWRG